jgi:peptidoglycan/LPS O-acetylase OafA/YrhL
MKSAPQICLDALDGIRGLCSIWVVVGHLITFWIPNVGVSEQARSDFPIFGCEYMSAVTMFFVISGFTLILVYDSPDSDTRPAPLSTWEQKKDFFFKRMARLGPIYYLGLLVGIAPLVVYAESLSIAMSVPVALLWLQSIVLVGLQWNGPLWTVSAFAICYLTFPKFLIWSRKLTSSQLMVRLGLSCLSSWIVIALFLALVPEDKWLIAHIFCVFRIPHFLTGIYAGLLAKRCPPSHPTLAAEICSCTLIAEMVVCAVLGTGNHSYLTVHTYIADFALPPIHALWIMALTHPDCRGPTRFLLSSPPARFLGDISYSLYCLHFPVISWCCWAVAGRGVSRDAVPSLRESYFCLPAWAVVPILAVCILVAAAAFYLIEDPARRWITGRSKGRTPIGTGADAASAGERAAGGGDDGELPVQIKTDAGEEVGSAALALAMGRGPVQDTDVPATR